MDFFATAAKGTEGALRDELRELGMPSVRADRGGVHFSGSMTEGARVCLWSRIAVRVFGRLAEFTAPSAQALYDGVRTIDWKHYLRPDLTLAVFATCSSSALTHSQYVALKTKDAVVDALRDSLGSRPSVNPHEPDVRIAVRISRDRA